MGLTTESNGLEHTACKRNCLICCESSTQCLVHILYSKWAPCAVEYGELCDRNRFEAGSSHVSSREISHLEIPPCLLPLLASSITRVPVAKGPTLERSCVSLLGEYASCGPAAFWVHLTAVHVGQSFASHLLS